MATAEDVLNVARAELGYYAPDDPEAGSKYGRWMADVTGESWLRGPSRDVWWCTMFVSWCLDQAGVECEGFPSYNTDNTISRVPASMVVSKYDLRPGDIVIWDWDGNTATDHIGFVEEASYNGWLTLKTIEGNVFNAVKRMDRSSIPQCIACCIRPPYEETAPQQPASDDTAYPANAVAYAERVCRGEFGNYPERVDNIYNDVQGCVNTYYWEGKDVAQSRYPESTYYLAVRAMEGSFGNEPYRRLNLYNYVQDCVNWLLASK